VTDVSAPSPAFETNATVIVTSASKWFGQKVAVSDVSCSFGPGVTGLLGPNGAGKTTLLRMLTGLIGPSEGTVSVLGSNLRDDPSGYRQVGLVPEEDAVYGGLTARQFIAYGAKLGGLPDPAAAAQRALSEVEMLDAADRQIGGFSKGMRQRTKVAAALANDPSILILDEPLNGTDPVQRAKLIGLFRKLGANGRTVIVSSHVLQEVERMTDRVLAMVDGKLAAAGDISAIRKAMTDIPYRVRIEVDDPRKLGAALLGEDVIDGITIDGSGLHAEARDLAQLGTLLPQITRALDLRLTTFRPEDESLESVFRYLVRGRR
jgi:ABC-2 type transport system ATP-binding protein